MEEFDDMVAGRGFDVAKEELARRGEAMQGRTTTPGSRKVACVCAALRAYAVMTTGAARGAVRVAP